MGDNAERSTRRSPLIRLAALAGFCFPLLLLLGLYAPTRENQAAKPADRKRQTLLSGSVLFHRNDCRVCHSYGARGGKKGPSLVDDEWLHADGSVNGIKKVVEAGIKVAAMKAEGRTEPMPPASKLGLTASDVDAIARYLHGIAGLAKPGASEGELRTTREADVQTRVLLRGSVLYHQNNCRKCHYSGAAGGPNARGPSLVDEEWLHCDGSVTGIKKVMVNGIEFEHVKNKEKARSASMPTAKEMNLTDADIEAIARYLHGIAQLD